MTHYWGSNPQFKVEISGETFINEESMTVMVKRVENNLSYLVLQVDDYQSKNYVDVFDAFDAITVSLMYGGRTVPSPHGTWEKVFSGKVSTVEPHVSSGSGEVLGVSAWGEGKALLNTKCDESYGVESIDNSAVDTPKEILDDLITEHINKEFGGAASGYAIVNGVDNVHAGLSVTHLNSQYLDNFVNVNRICDLATAFAAGTPSVHWFVDPDKKLLVKEIDQDHSGGNWDRYYGGTQATATIEVTKDMILYDFQKNVEEYANSVLLYSKFRKPSEDWLNEDGGPVWGTVQAAATYDVAQFVVGSHSLKLEPTASPVMGSIYHPSTRDAHWDFTKCGSQDRIPTFNFYVRANDVAAFGYPVLLCTDRIYNGGAANNYYWTFLSEYMTPVADKWVHISLPIGPFYALKPELQLDTGANEFEWNIGGAPDWADINFIALDLTGNNNFDKWFDDMHFSGQIVRQARDVAGIAAHDLVQKGVRNDTAANDSLQQADDTGTAAQLCYAELLRRSQIPVVGMVKMPMLPHLLPGQTLHIHACLKKGYKTTDANAFKIDADFRVKDLRHIVNVETGFTTIVNLTSDVTNSHAFGVPNQYTLLKQFAGALKHSEARNLKGGDIDNQIPRLSVNY